MLGKYLSTFREYAESIKAYLENMAIRGYLLYTKSSPNAPKVLKCIQRICGTNLFVHGEDAKGLMAYCPNTPRNIIVHISPLIIRQI
jgi:hypothetical protein